MWLVSNWDVCLLRMVASGINHSLGLVLGLTLLVSFIGLRANVSIEKDWFQWLFTSL